MPPRRRRQLRDHEARAKLQDLRLDEFEIRRVAFGGHQQTLVAPDRVGHAVASRPPEHNFLGAVIADARRSRRKRRGECAAIPRPMRSRRRRSARKRQYGTRWLKWGVRPSLARKIEQFVEKVANQLTLQGMTCIVQHTPQFMLIAVYHVGYPIYLHTKANVAYADST
jgi:hypothetical protein